MLISTIHAWHKHTKLAPYVLEKKLALWKQILFVVCWKVSTFCPWFCSKILSRICKTCGWTLKYLYPIIRVLVCICFEFDFNGNVFVLWLNRRQVPSLECLPFQNKDTSLAWRKYFLDAYCNYFYCLLKENIKSSEPLPQTCFATKRC